MSESFQTSNAVDVSYSNAVTGTKEIQFLGLRGLYTQFLIENRTAFDGILSTMGYDLIPGTWLDQVNILKGASSALHGSQSMAGAINVQLKKPDTDHPVYLNLFGDLHGRLESNLHLNKNGMIEKQVDFISTQQLIPHHEITTKIPSRMNQKLIK